MTYEQELQLNEAAKLDAFYQDLLDRCKKQNPIICESAAACLWKTRKHWTTIFPFVKNWNTVEPALLSL